MHKKHKKKRSWPIGWIA